MFRKLGLLIISAFLVLLLSSCSEFVEKIGNNLELKKQIEDYNQDGIDFMEEGKFEEARDAFYTALNIVEENSGPDNLKDMLYNNLSWVYNEFGEYEKSLEYIDKALEISPNSEYEFENKGYALHGLHRNDEALEYYSKAIQKNNKSSSAYYSRGSVYYDIDNYEKALIDFEKYLTFDEADHDGAMYVIYSYLYLGKEQQALEFAENWIQKNEDDHASYEVKSAVLEWIGGYDDLIQFHDEVASKFPDHLDALITRGRIDYDHSKYKNSLNYFITLLESHPDQIDLYIWTIHNFNALGEPEKALTYYNKAIEIDPTSYELHNAMGDTLLSNTLYMESVHYFDKSIEHHPLDEDGYINKIYALYQGKRYSRCIGFGEEAERIFEKVYNIPWFIAECHFELGNFQDAIKYYKKTLELDTGNDEVLSDLAFAYLLLEDYKKAKDYSEEALAIYSDNYTALNVIQSIEEKQRPIGEQISEFFYNNYLYNDNSFDLNNKMATHFTENLNSNREIAEAINEIKNADDIFTFVIYGEDYDDIMEMTDSNVEYQVYEEDLMYLRINSFTANADNNVIEILDNMEDTENKRLVIDLRGNTGGQTTIANNILDSLLAEFVTSTLIFRDGYTYNYYSDASQIPFKHIFILVDEYTASAAELLTLGLKTYLNNVTVLGRNTFGKGVGQTVFEDKKLKIMVFVTSHYWNVRQTNIMKSHIEPDVYIKGNKLKDFINAIPKTQDI